MKFYNLKKILKKQSTYNVIIGERSNGKTYSALLHAVKEYFKTGGELAILRRWGEDVKGKRASGIFASLVANDEIKKASNGEYTHIHYYSGRFHPATIDEQSGKIIFDITKIIGYAFALTEAEHNKSIAFPNVTNIIFDEFLTNKLYLPDEFILFMNTISTIIRHRENVKIFLLGNTVNKYCPYFQEMGLTNIIKMKQGDIDIYQYGDSKLTVAVEYCTSLKMFKKNNHFFAFDNPKLSMITGGAWELSIYPHLPEKFKKHNILLTYFIEFNDLIFQCEVVSKNSEAFTFIHAKTTDIKKKDDLIYTFEPNHKKNYNTNILKPQTETQKKITWFFDTSRVFYSNNEVGDTINNYLKLCKRG